uniref:BZIP domain-containing protein n=1 Tax=Globisporangium ultimum (strain ATCC 200006 / CBS 805.95 / DAOM BR144) TaxID=431595 RepID=K3WDE5_GLOUD
MEPLQAAQLQFLPTRWTPTDQVIMEDLLLHTDDEADAPVKPPHKHTAYESGSESVGSVPRTASVSSSSSSPSSCSGDSVASSPVRRQPPPATREKHARPSKVSDEERRARHRAVQKRFVQRKKEAIKQTKKLAAELEQQYQLLQISAESRALQKENEVLQAAVRAAPSQGGRSWTPANIHAILADQMELVREFFEPLSLSDWTTHLRQNLDEYDVAAQDRSYLTSGLTVMGWHDQRKIDDASVKFVLSKEFVNVRAVDLMRKTWAQLSSPQTHTQFFSPVFAVKVQVLQVINDNALVIHRTLFNPQTGGISHALDLLCRVQRGHDFIIFESAIDHNAVHACLGESHKWTKMTVSQVFSPSPSALTNPRSNGVGCIFRHGGWLHHFVASNVKYWFMEMFFMALRYESAMVAPVFCLPPPEEEEMCF